VAHSVRFAVSKNDDGVRLDQALARNVPGLSRRRARVLIDIGGVFVDRARVKAAGRTLRTGQVIEAHLGGVLDRASGLGQDARARSDATLPAYRIVHEDEHVIVVDKPAGLVTAPTPESDRGNLLDLLSRRPGAGPTFLVHRIDLPTSGLVVFARTDLANRILAARFASHDIEREYLAVVVGTVPSSLTMIERPISGRRAITHIIGREVVAGGRATVVTVRLETGRNHQIRIHFADLGNPVLGDPQHGAGESRRFEPAPPRMALHAAVLGFVHPATGQPVRWVSPIPDDLAPWCAALRAEPVSAEGA
jgi:23S rRNA pseudouridine1911/1915/1917 synthase